MYAPVIQAMATEQIRQHHAAAAAAGRARQIRRARRRTRTEPSVPVHVEQAERTRAHLRVVT
jgi:hypothetical protein